MTSSLIFFLAHLGAAAPTLPPATEPLPRPASLEPAVAFWSQVFGAWEPDQVVYFDARNLDKVYEVRRLPPCDGSAHCERNHDALRARWKEGLVHDLEALAAPGMDYDGLTGRRERLFRIWDGARDPEVYRRAAEEVRTQRGARSVFHAGVARSARYVADFRRIFREEGVPEEIVFLPHVESSYRWNAKSKVGALGMWQFMTGTAKRYMVVSHAVDERLDPHTAARAAARYLREAHGELDSWPLAVTSYNHGVDGMKNAIRETGSNDIETVIAEYDGPLFGFAGRNFYPELLAASALAESILAEPGELVLDVPDDFTTFQLPAYVKLEMLADAMKVPRQDILALNPSIRGPVRRGDAYLPRGMNLKLPVREGLSPEASFAAIPEGKRPLVEPLLTYRVQRGDTLGAIANRNRTTVAALQRLNGIRDPRLLRVGAVLKLPH